MPSDIREAVARGLVTTAGLDFRRADRAKWESLADAALAVIRERLAEKVRHAEPADSENDRLYGAGYNACLDDLLADFGETSDA